MNPLKIFNSWFDVRPGEFRPLLLSFFGAFLIIGFMIMARSLREALYLTSFDVKTLPYITITVAILGLPAVNIFSRLLTRFSTQGVLRGILIIQIVGLGLLWAPVQKSKVAVVLFYLWTTLGTILLTSGFWIVVSEHFPLRGAKRLFGLISAGGTAGAMLVGTTLGILMDRLGERGLIFVLMGFLFIFLLTELFLPAPLKGEGVQAQPSDEKKSNLKEACSNIIKNPHLRTIAMIVGVATLATTLLDYQFKELVRGNISTKAGLTSFFGAFYGWTGAFSLFIQLVVTSRLLSRFGIGWTLAVLPLILFFGSLSLLIIPTIIVVTVVRGMDNSLRKSLHRSALEVLYVPVPSFLRRKTKTFIDSTVDTLAEGFGAAMIFLWVTWGNMPSRFLSVAIVGLAAYFLWGTRRMNREYYETLVERLKEGDIRTQEKFEMDERMEGRDLLSASFTHIDLEESLKERGIVFGKAPQIPLSQENAPKAEDPISLLRSKDALKIGKALAEEEFWQATHIRDLLRVITRDIFCPRVTQIISEMGDSAIPALDECLNSEETDFVIRRRIPRILARMDSGEAEAPLLKALVASRFEIRYRVAIALMKRQKKGRPESQDNKAERIWQAVRFEVNRERAVWEMQRILDEVEGSEQDTFVQKHVEIRGALSLEHTFRLLALVLDPAPVQSAYRGILLDDEKMKSFALEYLDHVLPVDIRQKLWPFIGDIGEHQREKSQRPLENVVDDLMTAGATLFGDPESKKKLKEALEKIED